MKISAVKQKREATNARVLSRAAAGGATNSPPNRAKKTAAKSALANRKRKPSVFGANFGGIKILGDIVGPSGLKW